MGQLWVVGTPIGNLGDWSLRAIETLKSVDLVIAEDTRHSRKLWQHYDLPRVPWESCHAQTSPAKIEKLVERLSEQNLTAAYLSDAGTPGISDPGGKLVESMRTAGVLVSPLPGVSAVTTLLSIAGIPADRFTFLGFLPHKKGRQSWMKELNNFSHTVVFFESVHRVSKLAEQLPQFVDPQRRLVVGRELTKQYEEVWAGTVGDFAKWLTPQKQKGEFVLALAPPKFVAVCE